MGVKRKSILFLCIVLNILLFSGCKQANHEGVIFVSEAHEKNLEKEKFLVRLNKEIVLNNEPIVFTRVVFDLDSVTFAYKSRIILNNTNIIINQKNVPNNKYTRISGISMVVPPNSSTTDDSFHVITVPVDLNLEMQELSVKVVYDGTEEIFEIPFPGDRIAKQTSIHMFDSSGKETSSAVEAKYNCIAGINYTLIESIDSPAVVKIEDINKRKILNQMLKVNASNSYLAVFQPLQIPRGIPKMVLDTNRKTIQITY